MSDLIDRNAFRKAMYHEAMEKDSDWQKWDSGCWIRYKMFERVVDSMPSVQPTQKNDSNTLDALDCVSRKKAIDQLHQSYNLLDAEQRLEDLPSAQPDKNMIHIQKEQAYMQGWEEGREALRKELLEDERDRLD